VERGSTAPWGQTSEGREGRRNVSRPDMRLPCLFGIEYFSERKEERDGFASGTRLAEQGLRLNCHGGVREERQSVPVVHMQRIGASAIVYCANPGTVDS